MFEKKIKNKLCFFFFFFLSFFFFFPPLLPPSGERELSNTFQIWERRSQWPRGLGRRSTAARLLRSWVRIPPGAWMSVCRECCVLSGRGLCD